MNPAFQAQISGVSKPHIKPLCCVPEVYYSPLTWRLQNLWQGSFNRIKYKRNSVIDLISRVEKEAVGGGAGVGGCEGGLLAEEKKLGGGAGEKTDP